MLCLMQARCNVQEDLRGWEKEGKRKESRGKGVKKALKREDAKEPEFLGFYYEKVIIKQ